MALMIYLLSEQYVSLAFNYNNILKSYSLYIVRAVSSQRVWS